MNPAWAHLVDITQYFPPRLVALGRKLLEDHDPPLQSLLFVDLLQKDAFEAPGHSFVNCLSNLPAFSKLLAFSFRRDGAFVVLNSRRKELFAQIQARSPFEAGFEIRVEAFKPIGKNATDEERAAAIETNAQIAKDLFAFATSEPSGPVGVFDSASESLTNVAVVEACGDPFKTVAATLAELRSGAASLKVMDVSSSAIAAILPFCDEAAAHRARLAGRVAGAYLTAGVAVVSNAVAGATVTVLEKQAAAAVAAGADGEGGDSGAATAALVPAGGVGGAHEVRANGLDLTHGGVLSTLERQHEKPSSRAKDALVGGRVTVDGIVTAEELPVVAAGVASGRAILEAGSATIPTEEVPEGGSGAAMAAAVQRYAFAATPSGEEVDAPLCVDGSVVVSMAATCNTLPSAATRTLVVEPSPQTKSAYAGLSDAHDAAIAAAGADGATVSDIEAAAVAAAEGTPCSVSGGGLGLRVVVAPLQLGFGAGDAKAALRAALAAACVAPKTTALPRNAPLYIATVGVARATAKTQKEVQKEKAKEPKEGEEEAAKEDEEVKKEGEGDGDGLESAKQPDAADVPETVDIDAPMSGYTVFVLGDTIAVGGFAPPDGYEASPKDAKVDGKADEDDENLSREERRAAAAARRAAERAAAARQQWAAVTRAADGGVEVFTGPLSKAIGSVTLEAAEPESSDEDDEEAEKQRRKARFEALPATFDRSKLRGAQRVMKDFFDVNTSQGEVWAALKADVKENGFKLVDPTQQKREVTCLSRFANDKLQPYKRSSVELRAALSRVPADRQRGHVFFDEAHLSLFVPMDCIKGGNGPPAPVPLYAATLRPPAPWRDTEGGSSNAGLRILFHYTAKTSSVAKHNDCCFIKEIVVVSQKGGASSTDYTRLKDSVDGALKRIKQRDLKDTNEATAKRQPPLKLLPRTTAIARLPGVTMRPSPIATRGKKNSGAVELHANGLRFSISGMGDSIVDIIFSNIKHALVVTASLTDMLVLMHFHLHAPILVAKKPTADLQFVFEFDEEELRGGYLHTEEMEERLEQKQRAVRAKMNREFTGFAMKVEPHLDIKFELPEKHEQFTCSVSLASRPHGHVFPRLFARCIAVVEESPFIVLPVGDVEIAIFEGVDFGRKQTCDCVLVFKGYTKTAVLGNLSQTAYRLFQMYFCTKRLPFLEITKEGAAWQRLLPQIRQQAKEEQWNPWSSHYGWPSMIESRPPYVPIDSDVSSSEDEGDSDDDSDSEEGDSEFTASSLSSESDSSWSATSDEDAAPSEDSDDSAEDWSDHERRAVKADRRRAAEDDDDDDHKKRRAAPARSASSQALARAAASRGQQKISASGQVQRTSSRAVPARPVRAAPARATAARTTTAHRPDAMRARASQAATARSTGAVRQPRRPLGGCCRCWGVVLCGQLLTVVFVVNVLSVLWCD